jgi:hypothetical protein
MASVEEHFERLKKMSIILNPAPRDPKTRPRSSRMIFGTAGVKAERDTILAKGVDWQGRYRGRLEYRRAKLKEVKERWKHEVAVHPKLEAGAPPTGRFLDDINLAEARVKILEAEARVLNKLIAEHEKAESEREEKRKLRRARKEAKRLEGRRRREQAAQP